MSMSTTSASSSAPALTASNATAAGSAPSRSERTVGTPTRAPQVSSWSAAAARKVSAAPRTTSLSSATSTRASLPTVVVLPVPLTPTTSTTAGRPSTRALATRAVERGVDEPQQVLAQPAADRGLVGRALDLDLGPQRCRRARSCLDPEVGGDEGVLDLLPRLLVEAGRGTAGRAVPGRARCWSGPAGRAAGAAARSAASGRSRVGRASGSGSVSGRRRRERAGCRRCRRPRWSAWARRAAVWRRHRRPGRTSVRPRRHRPVATSRDPGRGAARGAHPRGRRRCPMTTATHSHSSLITVVILPHGPRRTRFEVDRRASAVRPPQGRSCGGSSAGAVAADALVDGAAGHSVRTGRHGVGDLVLGGDDRRRRCGPASRPAESLTSARAPRPAG